MGESLSDRLHGSARIPFLYFPLPSRLYIAFVLFMLPVPFPYIVPPPFIAAKSSPFSIFFLPALALPALAGWFYQTQRWAVVPDSVTLKCIPRKILPFCERVIFREKRRKGLVRQPCTASVNPKRFRQKRTEQRETKNKNKFR